MKGDFLGFSFDGIHCSQLGITHVSSSDRYDEDLFPEVKDKTIEIPNNHGEYYYGSTYGTRTFEINIAYDSITEAQFRNIRRLFGTRKVCELIFDERPYKVYYAKIESPIEMSYVCFDEEEKIADTEGQPGIRITDRTYTTEDKSQSVILTVPAQSTYIYTFPDNTVVGSIIITTDASYESEEFVYTFTNETEDSLSVSISYSQSIPKTEITRETIYPWIHTGNKRRIYKGEGTISLICYQPFAHQLFKIKELYEHAGKNKGNLFTAYSNVDEWIESSGILTENEWNAYHIDQTVRIPGIDVIANEGIIVPAHTTTPITYTLAHIPESEVLFQGVEPIGDPVNYTYSFINNTETDQSGKASYHYTDYESIPYTYAISVYNPGDLNVGFSLYIPFSLTTSETEAEESVYEILPKDNNSDIIINGDTEVLVLTPIQRKNQFDTGILIDTRTHLIEGVNYSQISNLSDYRTPAWKKTGTLYNEYIKIGEFPYIKRNDWHLDNSDNRPQTIYISCKEVEGIGIYYDYLYF